MRAIRELTGATGRLEDSGRHNDEKMSRKIGDVQSLTTFFRHSAVLSVPAVLLRKLPNKQGRPWVTATTMPENNDLIG